MSSYPGKQSERQWVHGFKLVGQCDGWVRLFCDFVRRLDDVFLFEDASHTSCVCAIPSVEPHPLRSAHCYFAPSEPQPRHHHQPNNDPPDPPGRSCAASRRAPSYGGQHSAVRVFFFFGLSDMRRYLSRLSMKCAPSCKPEDAPPSIVHSNFYDVPTQRIRIERIFFEIRIFSHFSEGYIVSQD